MWKMLSKYIDNESMENMIDVKSTLAIINSKLAAK
jgi:hypothetical protein